MISSAIVEREKYEVMSGIEIFLTYYLKTIEFENSDIYYDFLSIIRNHISGLTNELATLRDINKGSPRYNEHVEKVKFIMNELKTDVFNHRNNFSEHQKIDDISIFELIYSVGIECDNFINMEFHNYDIVERMHTEYLNIWDRLGNDKFYNLPIKKIKKNTKENHIVNDNFQNKIIMFSLGLILYWKSSLFL